MSIKMTPICAMGICSMFISNGAWGAGVMEWRQQQPDGCCFCYTDTNGPNTTQINREECIWRYVYVVKKGGSGWSVMGVCESTFEPPPQSDPPCWLLLLCDWRKPVSIACYLMLSRILTAVCLSCLNIAWSGVFVSANIWFQRRMTFCQYFWQSRPIAKSAKRQKNRFLQSIWMGREV